MVEPRPPTKTRSQCVTTHSSMLPPRVCPGGNFLLWCFLLWDLFLGKPQWPPSWTSSWPCLLHPQSSSWLPDLLLFSSWLLPHWALHFLLFFSSYWFPLWRRRRRSPLLVLPLLSNNLQMASFSTSVVCGTPVSGLILGLALSSTLFVSLASEVVLSGNPSPDLGAGFGFSGVAFYFFTTFEAGDGSVGFGLPRFCLPMLQTSAIFSLINSQSNSSPPKISLIVGSLMVFSSIFSFCFSRKFTFFMVPKSFPSGSISSIVTFLNLARFPFCRCLTASPCIWILPLANPSSRVKAVELGDNPCTRVGKPDFHSGNSILSDPATGVPPVTVLYRKLPF